MTAGTEPERTSRQVDAASEIPAERAAAILEQFESESAVRRLTGAPGRLAAGLAAGLSLYAIWWVLTIVEAQTYRTSFLLVALVLTFMLYPGRRAARP